MSLDLWHNTDDVFFKTYENTLAGEPFKMGKYASALKDPRNKVTHTELITLNGKASAYPEAPIQGIAPISPRGGAARPANALLSPAERQRNVPITFPCG
ncbi:hypothetical protein ACH4E7_19715 [Kitasatospora sp. NPDC018058]|uniref:hypothetical protein n=1 Tax=Kitasatospora sp. NPDC018058 TaxID=3364025 RepID=UPI0037BEF09C